MNEQATFFLQLAIGLGLFAFGWTLFRFGVKVTGFALGFFFGFTLYEFVAAIVPRIDPGFVRFLPQHPLTSTFVGIVMGIIGVLFSKKAYQVTLFLGALMGSLYILYTDPQQRELIEKLMASIGILEPIVNTVGNIWPAILSVLIALLFLYCQKQIIVILTACTGAYIIADTIDIPIFFVPLCFVGFLLQQTKYPRKVKQEETEE